MAPPLPDRGYCFEETALIAKDGHSAIAKLPDGLPSAAALDHKVLGWSQRPRPRAAENLHSSWRCPGGSQRRAGLYRIPALPVYTSSLPGSSLPGGHAVSVQKYRDDTRDWRKLKPKDIVDHLAELEAAITEHALHGVPAGIRNEKQRGKHSEALQQLEGLVSAVSIGTLQACFEKSYWAPSFADAHGSTKVQEIRAPMSCLFKATPDTSGLQPLEGADPELRICADISPLAACQELALSSGAKRRVALVRFSTAGDRRSLEPCLADHREAQLFMQTTYLQALLDMPRHLHTDPVQAVDAGGLIYTSDVAVLRGPLQGGAPWLSDPPLIDVLWVALQRTPMSDSQGQYSRVEEKAQAASTIDRIFACAASNGVDVLVIPPPGVGGAAGCRHPAEDMGDLLRKAVLQHEKVMPSVWVCQEYPGQLHSTWAPFAAALKNFRPPIQHRELVPMIASPYVRPGWEPKQQKKKATPRSLLHADMAGPASARGNALLGRAGRAIAY